MQIYNLGFIYTTDKLCDSDQLNCIKLKECKSIFKMVNDAPKPLSTKIANELRKITCGFDRDEVNLYIIITYIYSLYILIHIQSITVNVICFYIVIYVYVNLCCYYIYIYIQLEIKQVKYNIIAVTFTYFKKLAIFLYILLISCKNILATVVFLFI